MKRTFDIFVSFIVLVLFVPVFVALACAIRLQMGSPVFFRQMRPGLHGRPFEMIKFRTMGPAVDQNGQCFSDEKRITRLGQFLRSTSLDELPELWNVLKGDMSLVGPRPLLMEYLPFYTPEQSRRHEVRPGVTGWAQVNGRNEISWEEKFALDVWYVDNRSMLVDIRILLKTASKVWYREGINTETNKIMPRFDRDNHTHMEL